MGGAEAGLREGQRMGLLRAGLGWGMGRDGKGGVVIGWSLLLRTLTVKIHLWLYWARAWRSAVLCVCWGRGEDCTQTAVATPSEGHSDHMPSVAWTAGVKVLSACSRAF